MVVGQFRGPKFICQNVPFLRYWILNSSVTIREKRLQHVQNIASTLANAFFKNYCQLYTPKSTKETKQKILKFDS